MRFFSEATNYLWFKLLLVAMLAGMIWRSVRSRTAAIQALIAFPLANLLTDQFKHFLPELRPFKEHVDVIQHGFGWSDSFGTASAHSANMAAVAFVFIYQLGWWGMPWAFVALFTGLSRIYGGVHYPHQVLLGWTCGLTIAAFVCLGWDFWLRWRVPKDSDAMGGSSHGEET